jgi:hypothetical protein
LARTWKTAHHFHIFRLEILRRKAAAGLVQTPSDLQVGLLRSQDDKVKEEWFRSEDYALVEGDSLADHSIHKVIAIVKSKNKWVVLAHS